MNFDQLVFLVFWLGLVPYMAALISDDITKEKVGTTLTAWIDRRFRGSLAAYFVRCPLCISHWVVFLLAAINWRSFWDLPIKDPALRVSVSAGLVFFTLYNTRRCLS